MSEVSESPWQKDWSGFIDELEGCLRTSENTDDLALRFGNKIIEWEGVLDRKQIDELAPSVNLALPEKHIDFGDGRVAMLKSVSLPLADSAIADWQQIVEGTKVRFSAMVGAGDSPFPPVEVTNLHSLVGQVLAPDFSRSTPNGILPPGPIQYPIRFAVPLVSLWFISASDSVNPHQTNPLFLAYRIPAAS